MYGKSHLHYRATQKYNMTRASGDESQSQESCIFNAFMETRASSYDIIALFDAAH
jgi:hypothetical protein